MHSMPPSTPPRSHPHDMRMGNRGLTQAYDLRDLAAKETEELRAMPLITLEDRLARAKAIQALAVVWRDASDRIRILRGRPLPGSKRPAVEQPKHKVKASPSFTEEP